MDTTREQVNFGKQLAAQRERRGLSHADVVQRTKLPALLIRALEDGEAEKFPERPFMVNALRSYASAVGLDPDETIARFTRLEPFEGETFDPAALERARRDRALGVLLMVIAAVGAGALGSLLRTAAFFATQAAR